MPDNDEFVERIALDQHLADQEQRRRARQAQQLLLRRRAPQFPERQPASPDELLRRVRQLRGEVDQQRLAATGLGDVVAGLPRNAVVDMPPVVAEAAGEAVAGMGAAARRWGESWKDLPRDVGEWFAKRHLAREGLDPLDMARLNLPTGPTELKEAPSGAHEFGRVMGEIANPLDVLGLGGVLGPRAAYAARHLRRLPAAARAAYYRQFPPMYTPPAPLAAPPVELIPQMAGGGLRRLSGLRRLMGDAMPKRLIKPEVIKERGGNWIDYNVGGGKTPADEGIAAGMSPLSGLRTNLDYIKDDNELYPVGGPNGPLRDALAAWTERNLKRYLMTQWGTADDPLADMLVRGELPYYGGEDIGTVLEDIRHQAGVGDLARPREDPRDYFTAPTVEAGSPVDLARNFNYQFNDYYQGLPDGSSLQFPDWVKHDQKYYDLAAGPAAWHDRMGENLRRVYDYLRTQRPEAIKNISVPDAFRNAERWHADLAKQKAAEGLKVQEGIVPYLQLPEGNWSELKSREALNAEGQMMGHCVGSYCDMVQEGGTRIFSFRDPQGMSHVTVEARPSEAGTGEDPIAYTPEAMTALEKISKAYWPGGEMPESSMDFPHRIMRRAVKEQMRAYERGQEYKEADKIDDPGALLAELELWEKQFPGQRLTVHQVKGKQNQPPVAKYIPAVAAFLRQLNPSVEGSSLNDLRRMGLFHVETPVGGQFATAEQLLPYARQRYMVDIPSENVYGRHESKPIELNELKRRLSGLADYDLSRDLKAPPGAVHWEFPEDFKGFKHGGPVTSSIDKRLRAARAKLGMAGGGLRRLLTSSMAGQRLATELGPQRLIKPEMAIKPKGGNWLDYSTWSQTADPVRRNVSALDMTLEGAYEDMRNFRKFRDRPDAPDFEKYVKNNLRNYIRTYWGSEEDDLAHMLLGAARAGQIGLFHEDPAYLAAQLNEPTHPTMPGHGQSLPDPRDFITGETLEKYSKQLPGGLPVNARGLAGHETFYRQFEPGHLEYSPWVHEKLQVGDPTYQTSKELRGVLDPLLGPGLDYATGHVPENIQEVLRKSTDPEIKQFVKQHLSQGPIPWARMKNMAVPDFFSNALGRQQRMEGVMRRKAVELGLAKEIRAYPNRWRWLELTGEHAIKDEGTQMANCVGQYCDRVKEGATRLFALRDPEGRSHATIEAPPQARESFADWLYPQIGERLQPHERLRAFGQDAFDELQAKIVEVLQHSKQPEKEHPDDALTSWKDMIASGEFYPDEWLEWLKKHTGAYTESNPSIRNASRTMRGYEGTETSEQRLEAAKVLGLSNLYKRWEAQPRYHHINQIKWNRNETVPAPYHSYVRDFLMNPPDNTQWAGINDFASTGLLRVLRPGGAKAAYGYLPLERIEELATYRPWGDADAPALPLSELRKRIDAMAPGAEQNQYKEGLDYIGRAFRQVYGGAGPDTLRDMEAGGELSTAQVDRKLQEYLKNSLENSGRTKALMKRFGNISMPTLSGLESELLYLPLRPSTFPRYHYAKGGRVSPLRDELLPVLGRVEQHYKLPANLLQHLAQAESNWDEKAVSRKGAKGLFQLMPATAKELGVTDPHDPYESAWGAGKYMAQLMAKFKDLKQALAAYNWGPGNMAKYGFDKAPMSTKDYVGRLTAALDSLPLPEPTKQLIKAQGASQLPSLVASDYGTDDDDPIADPEVRQLLAELMQDDTEEEVA